MFISGSLPIDQHSILRETLSEIKVSISNKEVERVSSTKTLDIIIDENLQWEEHVDSGSKKISKTIVNICTIINTMYKSLVLPNFGYCLLVWGLQLQQIIGR